MPKSVAQWTGVAVTVFVTFGADHNLFNAAPVGIFAGMLATFLVALGDRALQPRKIRR